MKAVDRWAMWRNLSHRKIKDLATGTDRSEWFYDFVKEFLNPDDSILEIGCGPGRNLLYLKSKGFDNLTGIDIRETDTDLNMIFGPAEILVRKMEPFDFVFTMAFLEHMPYDSFCEDVASVSKRVLVTIEDELHSTDRHFPRNYREVFEPLGYKQIKHETINDVGPLTGFEGRIFVK